MGMTQKPQADKVRLLSAATRDKIAQTAPNYDDRRSVVMPALHAAQKQLGYLPDQALEEIAEILQLPPSEVGAVASFYTMYFRRPVGQHIISLCQTLSCALCGSEGLLDYVSDKLNVKVGETTEDGRFRLNAVECLGACDMAPAAMIDDEYHGNLTREKIDEVLRALGS